LEAELAKARAADVGEKPAVSTAQHVNDVQKALTLEHQ